ncbi:hypothetical protein PR048_022128 [Dryococelus australis]|uniref:Uncharacterized protein n=1 Tax=Dryococelus australis TaxID=614101 RepID=A0ABQ9H0D0_9NEOP|nr:hypothetical protein PR048_022128 [Dryococelus australis]
MGTLSARLRVVGIHAVSQGCTARWLPAPAACTENDKIDVQHVYTEVTFAIGSQFNRNTQEDSEPIADLQRKEHRVPYCQEIQTFRRFGAVVPERLAHSPSIKANRVQFPAGLPDVRKWESCRTMPLVRQVFSEISRFPPPFHSGTAPFSPQSPSSTLKTSLLRAA